MPDATERLAVLVEANTKSYERAMARLEQRNRTGEKPDEGFCQHLRQRIEQGARRLSTRSALLSVAWVIDFLTSP